MDRNNRRLGTTTWRAHLLETAIRAAAVFVVVGFSVAPSWAAEESLRAWTPGDFAVEQAPDPLRGLGLGQAKFPAEPVEQLPFRGARHEFVTTTTGALVFRQVDLRLPGRMPIVMGRVYDSSISSSLPPPPPNQQVEPRWYHDLGKNWILSYSAYLIVIPGGVTMVAPEGDILTWTEQGAGDFIRQNDVPSRHWKLQRQSPTVIQETMLDGTKRVFTFMYGPSGGACLLTREEDRSGNSITRTYIDGYLKRIENSSGARIELLRPIFDPNYGFTNFPQSRVVQLEYFVGSTKLGDVFYDFDSRGLLTKVTDALGHDWTFGYGANDNDSSAQVPWGLNSRPTGRSEDSHARCQDNADCSPHRTGFADSLVGWLRLGGLGPLRHWW